MKVERGFLTLENLFFESNTKNTTPNMLFFLRISQKNLKTTTKLSCIKDFVNRSFTQ
jgi:hypothetical protein